jgi:hypothetical protein
LEGILFKFCKCAYMCVKGVLNFYFNFELSCINNTRRFYCDYSIHTFNVHWTSLLPSLYSHFSSSLLFQKVVSVIMLPIYMVYFNPMWKVFFNLL